MEQTSHLETTLNWKDRFVGIDQPVPLLDGTMAAYINLDNAASTPPLKEVMETLEHFLPYYSSVHRGSGFKSRLSTLVYDQAHEIIGRFVGADLGTNTVIFGKNTTEAINKLSYRFPFADNALVLTTQLEHHSNDLPWRNQARVIHIKATPEGRLDENDFNRLLKLYAGKVQLVAVTGASNVTGFIPPIHRLAKKTHAAGAKILVDAAQLAPHRRIRMKPDHDPEHLDFVAISAHKMYAPFGTGALIGPKKIFLENGPEYSGGGTIDVVTHDEVAWAGLPDRDEAGSPNVVGAVAMAAAAQVLMQAGMKTISALEEKLIVYALKQLSTVPGIEIYGETDPAGAKERVGAIPFNLQGISHFLVAAILGYEAGIGVRSGCFCAHPYVSHMLDIDEKEGDLWRRQIMEGNRSNMPGMIRISFGCYNSFNDIDRLATMLKRIKKGDYKGDYRLDSRTGQYAPVNYREPFGAHFCLNQLSRGRN